MSESQIFNAVRNLSHRDRDEYLDRACRDNSELRKRVERLLEADDGVETDFTLDVQSPPLDPDATQNFDSQVGGDSSFQLKPDETSDFSVSEKKSDAESDQSAGDWVGPYKLLQQIGEGGMGTVWMAEQTKPVQRRVALKLIKAGLAGKQVIARFEAERQAVAMMNHENIAKVLDVGEVEDGSPYFVMELVQGVPITAYCDKNRLTPRERLSLFTPVCQAIQHAHQKGIVHRDLKPTNILVGVYDGRPVAKVIDFGLAKALEQEIKLTDKTMFTEFGQVMGTMQYMSPEQAGLDGQDIDTRTDIYSLGIILYELLAGSTPLEMKTIKDNALMKILELVREQEPPRPSHRLSSSVDRLQAIGESRQIQPAKLRQILRGDLDWIIMKALEKDRARRYESATGFADDIERYLSGETVEARPPSAGYRMNKFIRKHRGLVASGTAVFLLLLAGIAGTSWGLRRAVSERELALENAEKEKDARDIAEVARDTAERSSYFGAIQMSAADIRLDDYSRLATTLRDQPSEYRGWEWGYLKTATREAETIGSIVDDPRFVDLKFVAVSPDEESIVIVQNRDVELREFSTRKVIWKARMTGETKYPTYANDGQIALTLYNKGIVILDAKSGKVVEEIDLGNAIIARLSPLGAKLYVGNLKGELFVINTETWQLTKKLAVHNGVVRHMAVSADGEFLALVCGEGTDWRGKWLYLLNAETLETVYAQRATSNEGIYAIAIVEEPEVLLLAEGGVRVLQLRDGKQIALLSRNEQQIVAIGVDHKSDRIATGDLGGQVNFYKANELDFKSNKFKPYCSIFADGEVREIDFLPLGGVAVSADSKPLQIWRTLIPHGLSPPLEIGQEENSGTYHVEYRPDGRLLIASGWWVQDKILVYDLLSKKHEFVKLEGLGGVDREIKCVHFRPGGNEIAAATPEALRFFDSSQGAETDSYPLIRDIPVTGSLNDISFSPTGEQVALSYVEGDVVVVDVTTEKVIATIEIRPGWNPRRVELNSDASLIAIHQYTTGLNEAVVLCDTATGKTLHQFPSSFRPHSHFDLAFHPSEPLLVVAEKTGQITFYDTNTGDAVKVLHAKATDSVHCLQFSEDCNRLITGEGNLIRIWDWKLGKSLMTIPMAWYPICVRFSPDGRTMASSTINGMQIWTAEPLTTKANIPSTDPRIRKIDAQLKGIKPHW